MTPIALTVAERKELFQEAAARRGVSTVVVEKDYWVCVALSALFGDPQPIDLVFKGGTSLSKCYGLIERFSEDVDLAFDREDLGFTGERDPEAAGLSNKRRRALLQDLSDAAADYISHDFKRATKDRLTALLPNENWSLDVDLDDRQTLLFAYPTSFEPTTYRATAYIRPMVRLELGARSDQTPCDLRVVTSITTEEFGAKLANLPAVAVPTLAAERTFWEKATLLHAENHRDRPFSPPRARSRHLYDLVQLAESAHGEAAIADTVLRDRVVAHKTLFFASASARYDLFQPPTIRLLPQTQDALDRLRSDYADMELMFFGRQPEFDTLARALTSLEARLNRL